MALSHAFSFNRYRRHLCKYNGTIIMVGGHGLAAGWGCAELVSVAGLCSGQAGIKQQCWIGPDVCSGARVSWAVHPVASRNT